MNTKRTCRALMAALAITAVAACGDDDDADTASPATTEADAAAPGPTAAAADAAPAAATSSEEYCAASLEMETAEEPEGDFESATPEEQAAMAKSYATDFLMPLAQQLRAVADPSVVADIDVGIAGLERLAETGDFEAAFTPEMDAALDRLHAHDVETCGWATVDVSAADYRFDGVPAELASGVTSFELQNTGAESHEMVLFRRNDGVTESVEELLAMPEDEVMTKVTMVAATGAEPGESEYAIADLEPGLHAMLCFIPVGTTADAEGSGPPHFTEGMVTEFEVV